MRYFGLDKKSEIRKIILTEVEDDVVGPRNGSDEIISENPTTMYLSGVLFPKETNVETDDEGELESEPEEKSSPNMGMKPSSMGMTCRLDINTKKILVKIQYGKYSPIAKSENHDLKFQREHFEFKKELDLSEHDPLHIELGEEGINLRYKIRKISENQVTLSVFIVNTATPQKNRLGVMKRSVFQPKIILSAVNENDYVFLDDESSFQKTDTSDPDALLLTLLFNSKKNFGTGHSCAVNWNDEQIKGNKINLIQTTFVPVQPIKKISHVDLPDVSGLDMTELSKVDDFSKYEEKLMPIIKHYENWILQLESQLDFLPDDLRATAREQITQCRRASERIERGIHIVSKNENHAGESFRFTNMAMALQQKYGNWAKSNRELGKVEGVSPPEFFGRWRLFQIAFVLLNIESIVYPTEPERKEHDIADLLWFPTGGGKTEAYLGIIAFTMSLRRLRGYDSETQEHSVKSYGISVIMRYTLRLLTVQQFQRASLLMCACEYIRRSEKIPNSDILKWGDEPFYVGIWVGGSTTPNTIFEAQDVLSLYQRTGTKPSKKNPCQLTNCPWCGAKITQRNYDFDGPIPQFRAYCSRDGCLFSKKKCSDDFDNSIPVLIVDQDVYCRCPSLLISTIDKFAQITWKEETGNLFGKAEIYCTRCGFTKSKGHSNKHNNGYEFELLNENTQSDPPELIVQDELHLISGPLGTLTGLYESAIDLLCMRNVGGVQIGPKIIASTATTKSATNQIHKLFDRSETRIFPPQGFSFGDSFFSKEETDENTGKLYVGICSTGKSGLTILAKISAAILRKVRSLEEKNIYNPDDLDPYYTLVSYFNSIREMGGAYKMYEDSVPGFMQRIYNNFEVEDSIQTTITKKESDEITDDDLTQSFETKDIQIASKRKWVNNLRSPLELTSRIESSEIPDILNELEIGLKKGKPVDTLLSSNMLSVGVDLPRLGVMIINGQPKNHAEYIQASGRIGRSGPGLIITSYNYLKPRDLSHYENFKFYHSTFYKHVESVSLTPFSARSRDRGLFGVVVALVRLLIPILAENNTAQDFDPEHVNIKPTLSLIRNFIERRVNSVDTQETENVLRDFDNVVREWDQIRIRKRPLKYKSNPHKLADKTKKQSEYYLLKTLENPETGEKFAPMSLRDAEKQEALWYVEEQ
jgi:hypothetical protein